MAGLTVKGDPYAWLDAGRSISTLMMQLESELPYAGGPVVGAWHGPTASAFTADWTSRRSRYEDLISHALTAAKAITAYGEKLYDLVQQAANLEATWCGLGLHVMETGAGFMLPPGFDLLPAGTQLSLHQTLAESRTDVEKMASDAVGAAEDLAVAIGAAIVALEDFQLIEVGAAGSVLGKYVHDALEDPSGLLASALTLAGHTAKYAEDESRRYASQLGHDLSQGASEARSVAGRNLRSVAGDARYAKAVGKAAERAGFIVGAAAIGVQVLEDRRQKGLWGSLEGQSGNIAALALSGPEDAIGFAAGAALVTAGAPVAVGVIGGAVVAGVVAVGVGYTVQEVVDHRKAIGHFAERVVADL